MDPEQKAVWRRTLRTSWPWVLLVLVLYGSQVFAILVATLYHRAKEHHHWA